MPVFRNLSIQRKLMLIIMMTTLLALVLASVAFFAYDIYTFRERMEESLRGLAETLKANTTENVVYNDRETASEILSALEVHAPVVTACIFDEDGEVFARYLRAGTGADALPDAPQADGSAFESDRLEHFQSIFFADQRIGTFYIASDLSELRGRLRNYSAILAAVVLTVSLIAFLVSSRLQRVISKPVLDLVEVEKKVIESQDYSVRAVKKTHDEIGLLIDAFNLMLSQIQARDEEITVARDRAEEANRSKSTFLANMSHELRTPLNAIIGYSEMLQEDAEDSGQDELVPDLRKIQAAGKHLLSLINGVLDLSKIEAGKMELYLEDFSVRELVDGVASTVKPLVEQRVNRLEVEVAGELGDMHADLTKTRQILLNLLSNAAKFTQDGAVRLEVARKRAGGADWLRFRVVDSGIGMTADQLARVFEPFSQADASTTRQYGGTGLGLSICKRFSEMMGGDIYAESEPGKGSVFTVQLPAQVDDASEAKNTPSRTALRHLLDSAEYRMKDYGTLRSGNAQQVLVIDDDPTVHELLTDLLSKEGFEVSCSASADDGLRLARKLRPVLITLDVRMPDKDGWHVLAALKTDPELSEIPVVMVSVVEDRKMAFALGASEYLTKPIERDRLSALLRKYRLPGRQPVALVVDDEEDSRGMLCQLLKREGWRVEEAENGIAALRRVTRNVPDLILLDLIMPELDGFGFVTELRKTAAWRSIPVVVVTAMDLGPEESRRLNGGVEKILQKGSFSMDQFKAEIRALASESSGR